VITYEVTLPADHPLAHAGNVRPDVLPRRHQQKMESLARDWKFQKTEEHDVPGMRKLVFHAEKPTR
jgi:hypothetical protein